MHTFLCVRDLISHTAYFIYCAPQTGEEVDGVVYPGVVSASIHLDPGDVACSSPDSTSCSATITSEGVYNVSLTLTNDVGPSQAELDMFDCEWILCMYIMLLVFMLHVYMYMCTHLIFMYL